jgi:hypothetical protein
MKPHTFPRVYLYSVYKHGKFAAYLCIPAGWVAASTDLQSLSISYNILSLFISVNADGLHLYIMLSQERQGQKNASGIWGGDAMFTRLEHLTISKLPMSH